MLDSWKCDTRSLFDGEVASAGDLRGTAPSCAGLCLLEKFISMLDENRLRTSLRKTGRMYIPCRLMRGGVQLLLLSYWAQNCAVDVKNKLIGVRKL